MMYIRFSAYLGFIVMLGAMMLSPAYAESPVPSKKSDALNKFDQTLEDTQAKEAALQSKIAGLKQEIESTKDKLIDVAKSVQKNEKDLVSIEADIVKLGGEKHALEGQLEKDHAQISNLVLTLERIRRVPPEAMMIKPDVPLKTAQTVLLLKEIIPAINSQTQKYKEDLEHLKDLEADLKDKKATLVAKSEKLVAEQKSLNGLISKREKLFASTQVDFKETQEAIKTISKKSKDLKELVTRIGEENQKRRETEREKARVSTVAAIAPPDIRDLKSGVQLPVSGAILIGYGQDDRFGAPSAGITIEGRDGALVISPMSGIVRFAGAFKHYGNMIIIEHDGEYHSLIAGLGEVNVYVDQSVNVGEPVAKLKSAVNGKKPSLYYELRHKGKAIDPAEKFSGLG